MKKYDVRSIIMALIPYLFIGALAGLLIRFCIDNCDLTYRCDQKDLQIEKMQMRIDELEGEVEGLEEENRQLIAAPVDMSEWPEWQLTDAEINMMAGVVHSEAGNQDMLGRRLVADVILNRVEDGRFPGTVAGVIHQENQFAAPSMAYTEDDVEAVMLECERRIDTDVLWFRTGDYHTMGRSLYQHGAHYFSGGYVE